MPIFVYTPDFEVVRNFYDKIKVMLPKDYKGWVGVRLHRTGNPLALEVLGEEIPDKELPPMVWFEVDADHDPKVGWDKVETDFDVPWIRPSDFHRYRDDVMTFYHAEDLLEPRAEDIIESDEPDKELLRKATFDHADVLAKT